MRSYERSHSWLKFEVDLRRLQYDIWVALGEAQSKCEHISRAPMRPDTAKNLHQIFLAKGVRGTTAIEGNTLSEEEVLKQLDGQLDLPPSKEYLGQETKNIIDACNEIADAVVEFGLDDLTPTDIKLFNSRVLRDLPPEESVTPGEIRSHSVGVAGARYLGAPAEDCDYLLERLCDWLRTDFDPPKDSETRIVLGLIKAILAHLYLAWIHPFGNGNGRTARLVEFKILLASGVPTPASHLLSNYYNETRGEYYRQLDMASKPGGDVIPFVKYAVVGFVEGLRSQLDYIWSQHLDVTWRNYVHELFKDKKGQSNRRKRDVALDLSLHSEPVPVPKIREISTRVAAHYAKVTRVAISRDINALSQMGLVTKEKNAVRANKELILRFLPRRAPVQ